MPLFAIILIIFAIVVIVFVVIVAVQPSAFRITRSATIAAAPSTVFPLVNDFHNWGDWSPWAKMDPSMNLTYSGAPAGTGAIYAWNGNKKVGEGRMTILETRSPEFVRINLEFLKPFVATNIAEFTFQPQGNQTLVNWSMTGQRNFVFKAFCMFLNMDKLVGGDFEKGLAQMKVVAESGKAI